LESDPTRMCALLVGLPAVRVLAVADAADEPIVVHVELETARSICPRCGASAWVKDRPAVELVDLPCFGRPAWLVWRKHRWRCPASCTCSWTSEEPSIAPARAAMTDRAARWATVQVGREGRTVAEVARELGCDWHTVNDAVMAYGAALLEADVDRVGGVEALGLDETLFCRRGRWRTQQWCRSIVNVSTNPVASMIETVRAHARNVKRWQDRGMRLRWAAAGMLAAAE
jgi:transposase